MNFFHAAWLRAALYERTGAFRRRGGGGEGPNNPVSHVESGYTIFAGEFIKLTLTLRSVKSRRGKRRRSKYQFQRASGGARYRTSNRARLPHIPRCYNIILFDFNNIVKLIKRRAYTRYVFYFFFFYLYADAIRKIYF